MPSEFRPPVPPPVPPVPVPPSVGPPPDPGRVIDDGIRIAGDSRAPELDGIPRRTSPLTMVPVAVGVIVAMALLLPRVLLGSQVAAGADAEGESAIGAILFTIVPLFFIVATAASGWFMRTYTVGSDELTIDHGVFARRRRVVPYGRIQQIDIRQGLLDRLLGLATLDVETAGTAEGSVKLGLLEVRLARGIRAHSLQRRAEIQGAAATSATGPQPRAPWLAPPTGTERSGREQVLVRLDTGRLVVAGLTHHWVLVAMALAVPVAATVAAFAVSSSSLGTVLVVLAIAVAAGLGFGVCVGVVAVLQYAVGLYGYTLAEADDDLHVRFGLLQARNLTIPRRRVQHVTVVDNPVRRLFGLVSVELHSAAAAGARRDGAGAGRFEIPIVARADLDDLLTELMGGDWRIGTLTPRSAAAKRRGINRRVFAVAVAVAVPMFAFPPWSLLFGLLVCIGVPWGLAAHARAGYGERAEVVVLAHGVFRHHVELVPCARVQSAACVQSPFQRLAGLRTLHVNVAGATSTSDPFLYDVPGDVAVALARDLPRRSGPHTGRAGGFEAEPGPF